MRAREIYKTVQVAQRSGLYQGHVLDGVIIKGCNVRRL
jgi:hypothetical protein